MNYIGLLAPFFYVVLFAIAVAIAAFLTGNAKAQANPWIFLSAAIVAILFGFGIQALEAKRVASTKESASSSEALARLMDLTCKASEGEGNHANNDTSRPPTLPAHLIALACKERQAEHVRKGAADNPMLEQLAQLIALTCSTFAGALASVAITNRAKFQHDKEIGRLKASIVGTASSEKWLKEEIGLRKHNLDIAIGSHDPGGILLAQQELAAAERLINKNSERKEALEIQLEELQEKA